LEQNTPELKIIPMSEIVPEPVNWLWEPYIPSGATTLIQGDGGLGKTTIALVVATAVTIGGTLPDSSIIIPANVIIQNAEDSYCQTIRPRLDMLGADCEKIFTIDEKEVALSMADCRIEQVITEKNAKLLIIDPVQAYFGKANMNSAGGVRPLLKHLGNVAAKHDCAVLLVGHLNKKPAKAQYAGLGSVDIFAASRSVLTVCELSDDGIRRGLVHIKSNLAPKGVSQAYSFDPHEGFIWLGACDATESEVMGKRPKAESQLDRAVSFLKKILGSTPVLATDIMEMADAEGISEKTLKRAKSELGIISRKTGEQWYWILPIDVEYKEVSQDAQDGQEILMDSLTSLAPLCIEEQTETAATQI